MEFLSESHQNTFVLLPALFGSDLTGDSVVRQLTRWFVARIGGGRPAGRPC